jgi:hypothetical protein
VFMRILYGIYISVYMHMRISTVQLMQSIGPLDTDIAPVPPQTRRAAALRDTLELLEEACPPLYVVPTFPRAHRHLGNQKIPVRTPLEPARSVG